MLWIDARADGQRVRLGGYCRYWIDGAQFGGYACPEHPEVGSVSYRWDGRWLREQRMPTLSTDVMVGEWLPDDVWAEVRR